MARPDDTIKIHGLRELQRALKQIDGEAQKKLRVVFNDVAQLVADDAKRRVPARTGAARKSIKPRSGQREAVVQAGSRRVPYYGWLDFGGKVGVRRNIRRRFISEGRYLYPALTAKRGLVQRRLDESIRELARLAGLEVTRG
jgi:hypothetical protein